MGAPWYIDGFNVLHAVLLGRDRKVAWWHRDFQTRVVRWVEDLVHLPPLAGSAITVVFDSERSLDEVQRVESLLVRVVYAPSADEWIVETCSSSENSGAWVLSADRALVERVKARGARAVRPWSLHSSSANSGRRAPETPH